MIEPILKCIETHTFKCDKCAKKNREFEVLINYKEWFGLLCKKCDNILLENKPRPKGIKVEKLSCKKCNKSNKFFVTYFSKKERIDFYCVKCETINCLKFNYIKKEGK